MVERFLHHIEAERRFSPLTVANYRRDIERFVAWWTALMREEDLTIEGFDPTRVTAEQLGLWISHRSKSGKIATASMNRELSSLRSLFRFLRREKLLDRDPFAQVGTLRAPKRLPVFVPESRMEPLVAACKAEGVAQDELAAFEEERDALILLMFYACGLRLAELIGINREDFSADYTSLRIRGKGNKERMVPILEPLREKIFTHLSTISRQQICINPEKALFLTTKGVRVSRSLVYRLVHRVLRAHGVQGKCSPHVLRHTFATHLMNRGADMRAIQELMGHASLRSTQVYTHNSITGLQAAYQAAHPRSRSGEGR